MALTADKANVEHPSGDLMQLYSMDRLTEPDMAAIGDHLLICQECRDQLTATDAFIAALRAVLSDERNWK